MSLPVLATPLDLLARLDEFERRIAKVVADRRSSDDRADDPFRGLYLPDDAIDALLEERRAPIVDVLGAGGGIGGRVGDEIGGRFGELAARAGLTPLDVDLLLVALAPDVDSRFEQFYGYLNDDVTRHRATIGLALRLAGIPEAAIAGRTRLDASAPLRSSALVVVEEAERPMLSRTLRVPDRVVAHLLGDDRADADIAAYASISPAPEGPAPASDDFAPPSDDFAPAPDDLAAPSDDAVDNLASALGAGIGLIHIRQHPGSGARDLATRGAHDAGFAAIHVDVSSLPAPGLAALGPALVREALMRGAVLVIGPLAASGPESTDREAQVHLRLLRHPGVPLITYSPEVWDPAWSDEAPLQVDALPLTRTTRAALWRAHMAGQLPSGDDPAEATAHFVLDPHQIARATQAAARHALAEQSSLTVAHLRAGARSQNASGLSRLARRIEPTVTFDDLVLPPAVHNLLGELAGRAKHRDRVLDEWRMRPGGGRGRGITGLFAGDPGTGKTMSAEAVAGALGMDLYTVNLASVVSKYIGETEKNLERIFTEAAGINGVLLFDEADAIFGKRSEVKDAHDRYANVESAYLLQRMETFDGIALLATNLRANLDEAFTRRLDVVIDFPLPDATLRRGLWDRCLGPIVPRADDIDFGFLATAFELAGGHIRSCAITAAYLAAQGGRTLCMLDLVGAVAREYRKLGRLTLDVEFGHYLPLMQAAVS